VVVNIGVTIPVFLVSFLVFKKASTQIITIASK
jgi:hypothetical protein